MNRNFKCPHCGIVLEKQDDLIEQAAMMRKYSGKGIHGLAQCSGCKKSIELWDIYWTCSLDA